MKLKLENLTKAFRDADRELRVIDSLTTEFPEKGSIAIVGRSGIGKSTLLNLLGGLERPTEGAIRYGDLDITKLTSEGLSQFRGRSIGFVFQFHHLLPEFSALENVAMPLLIAGEVEHSAAGKAKEILERVGLGARVTHRPGELSGGEQQRVAIARALVARPAVVLADEPTGNLDIQTARAVQGLLIEVNRELGNLLVVVTHLDELARSMDYVLEMMPGGALESRVQGMS